MIVVFFAVSLLASIVGSICGIGGGVIIKPVLDAMNVMSVSCISFLSGCTVLTMSVVSVYKNMRAGKKLNLRIATLLAVGAAVGGVAGKMMFQAVKASVGNENFVGMVQAIVLIGVTGITFVYTIFKKKIHTLTLNNAAVCVIVGLVLGIMSSFLGIGGGPINLMVLGFLFTPLFAFLGGVIAFVLVYSLSWKGGLSPLRIILVGVAVDAMFTGLSSALNSMNGGNMSGVAAIVNGNITMKTWDDVKTLVPYVIVGLVLALIMTKMCNLLALEDKTARSLGINVNAMRIVISLIAVLLASISTAVAGVISFLGLIVPHIGRILVGSDHKALVPFSALFGAFTFLLADTIGRTIAAPYEVSASIIMSVVGGPFFIILLRRSKKYAK